MLRIIDAGTGEIVEAAPARRGLTRVEAHAPGLDPTALRVLLVADVLVRALELGGTPVWGLLCAERRRTELRAAAATLGIRPLEDRAQAGPVPGDRRVLHVTAEGAAAPDGVRVGVAAVESAVPVRVPGEWARERGEPAQGRASGEPARAPGGPGGPGRASGEPDGASAEPEGATRQPPGTPGGPGRPPGERGGAWRGPGRLPGERDGSSREAGRVPGRPGSVPAESARSSREARRLPGGPRALSGGSECATGGPGRPPGELEEAGRGPGRSGTGPGETEGAGVGALLDGDPAVLRLALLDRCRREPVRLDAEALAEARRTLGRWRRAVAGWAREPSRPVPDEVRERLRAAWEDDLDMPGVLRVLRWVESEPELPDGARFETYVYADRLLGLDLARDLGVLT